MKVTARAYPAKDYAKALAEKEATGAIMYRELLPEGPHYIVRYVPVFDDEIHERNWRGQYLDTL